MPAPFADAPSRFVTSRDGTRIAVFSAGAGPVVVLVHGTTADHRTWRVVGPRLASRYEIHALDRRGRGDSGDGPAYAIEREIEDLVAVAEATSAASAGGPRPVNVIGHSLGGRIALGAALRTPVIRRLVAIESAPSGTSSDAGAGSAGTASVADARPVTAETPPAGAARPDLLVRLRADLDAGDLEGLLARFMTEAVGMPPDDLARFRLDPVWPLRVAAVPTIARELVAADDDPAVGLEAVSRVTVPVLQIVGSESPPAFAADAAALDRRLARGRLVVIEGARHGPHHSHPDAFLAAVEAFLDG